MYSANLISVPGILYQILNDDVVEKKKKKKEVFEEFLQAERLPPGSKIEKKERENPRISFITVIWSQAYSFRSLIIFLSADYVFLKIKYRSREIDLIDDLENLIKHLCNLFIRKVYNADFEILRKGKKIFRIFILPVRIRIWI